MWYRKPLIVVAFCLSLTPILTAVANSEEKVIRLGMIGLDTSHATAFAKLLNRTDNPEKLANCRVVAAYPKGSPDIESSVSRVPRYTAEMKELGVEIVDSIESLVEKVDGVLLETNDGRPHLEQIRPVLKAGKPVFIDKPMAGTLADVLTIFHEAQAARVPVFSSSSLRFMEAAQAVRNGSIGDVVGCDAYSPCHLEKTHPSFYWYGIHGVETLFTVMGSGCESVVRIKSDGTDVAVGKWKDGRIGTFRGIRDGKGAYGGTAFGTQGNVTLGEYGGYQSLVEEIVKFFRSGMPPVAIEETIQIYAFMEAADESDRQGGIPIKISDVIKKAAQQREN